MLPAANRLRTAADFRDTTRRGAKASRGAVVVYLNRASTGVEPRVGVIVSKAVGGSVQRHRAARRIRAAVRPLLTEVPPGATVVVRALPGADTSASLAADVSVGLQTLLGRA
jgi:ribonuclease P protein component